MGLIFISHDLNLVASFCDRVLVMYAGQIVEAAMPAGCTRRDIPTPAACSTPSPNSATAAPSCRSCGAIPNG